MSEHGELEELFALARARPEPVSEGLRARVIALGAAHQPPAARARPEGARPRARPRHRAGIGAWLGNLLGGFRPLGGIALAGVAGFLIGFGGFFGQVSAADQTDSALIYFPGATDSLAALFGADDGSAAPAATTGGEG